MPAIEVDSLVFDFPESWEPSRYDAWAFYRRQISRMWDGIRAVDVLAVDPDRTAWLIEVKDYRVHARTKPTDLAEEVAGKVFDTLAAMLPAKLNGNDAGEVKAATSVLGAKKLRVVLHMEQPEKHSTLRPRAIDPAAVMQRLR